MKENGFRCNVCGNYYNDSNLVVGFELLGAGRVLDDNHQSDYGIHLCKKCIQAIINKVARHEIRNVEQPDYSSSTEEIDRLQKSISNELTEQHDVMRGEKELKKLSPELMDNLKKDLIKDEKEQLITFPKREVTHISEEEWITVRLPQVLDELISEIKTVPLTEFDGTKSVHLNDILIYVQNIIKKKKQTIIASFGDEPKKKPREFEIALFEDGFISDTENGKHFMNKHEVIKVREVIK